MDSAPTPADPIVWAIVFNDNIAPTGRSMFSLYLFMREAVAFPCFSFMDMYDMGVESKTASNTEHMKESDNAPKKYNTINTIVLCVKLFFIWIVF